MRGLADRRTVCPSVRLFVTRVYCDKTNESSTDILIPSERKIHLLFRTQRMVGGGRPLYVKFWAAGLNLGMRVKSQQCRLLKNDTKHAILYQS